MQAVFPSTALKTDLRKVKEASQDDITLITDSKGDRFLFGSEEAVQRSIRHAAEDAAYEHRMRMGIERAKAGIAQGRYVEGAEAAIAHAEALRA